MRENFSHQSLIEYGQFNDADRKMINACRGEHNQLGFAYQLIFIRLFHRVPSQKPFEKIDEVLAYACFQCDSAAELLDRYCTSRTTIQSHQKIIISYLNCKTFTPEAQEQLKAFIYQQSQQFDPVSLLQIKAIEFLREQKILLPAPDTLLRLIKMQRSSARKQMFDKIQTRLSPSVMQQLDALLDSPSKEKPSLEFLKRAVKNPSVSSMLDLVKRIECIGETGALHIDLSCINNNYQRTLAHEIKRCSVDRIRRMEPTRRYTALLCFLNQVYQNNVDLQISSYIKLMNVSYTYSETKMDRQFKQHEAMIRESLQKYEKIKALIRDKSIPDPDLRTLIFKKFPNEFEQDPPELRAFLKDKKVQIFKNFISKYGYFRQFTPELFSVLTVEAESKLPSETLKALDFLKQVNQDNKRALPEDLPLGFLDKKQKKAVIKQGKIDRHAWECALYLKIRDDIKQGNLNIPASKNYSSIQSFFMPDEAWKDLAENFFKRAGFPMDPEQVPQYFEDRLAKAYQRYFETETENTYAKVVHGKWMVSTDPAETFSPEKNAELKAMKTWLNKRMRQIKLPELLIEVDNEVHLTDSLVPAKKSGQDKADDICGVLATLMAHGCNIGPYTMPKLTDGITYKAICRITDWQFTNDALRISLSWIVNALSKLGVTKYWGEGKTSSSDAHLKIYRQRVAQQTYQARIGDFALAFYTFVADNYAPFHSKPFEGSEGEAPHVLDGWLYNESDLALEEHFTDTRAAAIIIFSTFAWFGRKYSPRIRGVKNHHIYFINPDLDYKSLAPLLEHKTAKINMALIQKYWHTMAKFYAAIEQGKMTASVALKRLLALSKKNEFYKACVHLGRILKTEHILEHMSDSEYRRKKHRGLLKGEEIHQLARDINYANRGKITVRDLTGQQINCSCLTIIMACVIYWQAKELDCLINSQEFIEMNFDLSLISHLSPVGWDNIVLYGEYIINKMLIKNIG